MSKIAFSFLFTIWTILTAAACSSPLINETFLEVIDSVKDKTPPTEFCIFAEQLSQIASAINKFSPVYEKINIQILSVNKGAHYSDGGLLVIPQKLVRDREAGRIEKDIKFSYSAFAHEYGHSIFSLLLEKDFPINKEIRARLKRVVNKTILIEKKMKVLKENPKNFHLEDEVMQLEDEITTIKNSFNNEQFIAFNKLTASYQELFADVVAVLFTGNLRVIVEIMESPLEGEEERRHTNARDFTMDHSQSVWKNNHFHGFFAPTRTYLGKTISSQLNEAEKKQILINLYQAMKHEISYYLDNPTLLNSTDANQRLIDRFANI